MHPWTFGWEALVAIGTIGLAVATFVTAQRTKALAKKTEGIASQTERLADETRALADLQRLAQQASVKPTLIPRPLDALQVAGDQTRLGLYLKNVGGGLALSVTARMLRQRGADHLDEYGGTLAATVIPAGDEVEAIFRFGGQEQRFIDFTQGAFWIEVEYTDAVGGQHEATLCHVERMAAVTNELHVVRVELRRHGEDQPYASSGWGAVR